MNTTSLAGLLGNFGQANYAAAKLAVVGLSRTLAMEGAKYGVRSNAVSPSARTRIEASLQPPPPDQFDVFAPENVAPLICWLATADCPANGQVFQAYGNRVEVIAPSTVDVDVRTEGRWDIDELGKALDRRLPRLRGWAISSRGSSMTAAVSEMPGGTEAMIGRSRDSEEFRTDTHRLAQFARAVDDTNPRHLAGEGRAARLRARASHAVDGRGSRRDHLGLRPAR